MTDLKHIVDQLIDDQQDLISALRAMIGRGADTLDLADLMQQIEATDTQIQSLTAVLRKFADLSTRKNGVTARPEAFHADE